SYCTNPIEIRHHGQRKEQVFIKDEWIGEERNGAVPKQRRPVTLTCADAAESDLNGRKFDSIFTDPPYFGNVQYAELMDFCYVWLRRLVDQDYPPFKAPTTRTPGELTGNVTMERGLVHFASGIFEVFQKMATALMPGAAFAFAYQ